MAETVLIVEDEPDVSRLLSFNLGEAGFATEVVATGGEALPAAERVQPAVVVLDLMLPDLSGHEVCARLRAHPRLRDIGILMLTARGDEDDRIIGLEAGADDYVVKPFSVREVVLRVCALAKRAAARGGGGDGRLRWRELELDPVTHEVYSGRELLNLRPLEFKLLQTLMQEPGKVFSRNELLAEVWGISGEANTRTVDVHVKRLRTNLGEHADVVETVHGFGYRARRD
jgi:two-component system, OmpR family, phosphate regulon response regulator PhoB